MPKFYIFQKSTNTAKWLAGRQPPPALRTRGTVHSSKTTSNGVISDSIQKAHHYKLPKFCECVVAAPHSRKVYKRSWCLWTCFVFEIPSPPGTIAIFGNCQIFPPMCWCGDPIAALNVSMKSKMDALLCSLSLCEWHIGAREMCWSTHPFLFYLLHTIFKILKFAQKKSLTSKIWSTCFSTKMLSLVAKKDATDGVIHDDHLDDDIILPYVWKHAIDAILWIWLWIVSLPLLWVLCLVICLAAIIYINGLVRDFLEGL